MASKVILYKMKNLHLQNVSIHIDFYHNRFLNENARKNFVKMFEDGQTFKEFFVTIIF